MKEIINRLSENRQIELAKSILESAGYSIYPTSEDPPDSLLGYNINSPIVFSTVSEFREFMEEVIRS